MIYCNNVLLYKVYTIQKNGLNTDNSSIITRILNRHVFYYIYIHCILKTSGKCCPISVYTAIGH